MNTTVNGSSSWSCTNLMDSLEAKIGQSIAYGLILVVSLIGNSLIGIIVYKTPTLRKPINFLIANMAMSDLLYPIFHFPVRLAQLHGSWLIGGTLGQALCKLYVFLTEVSMLVSIQSLVLITVDRFGAVVVPLRSPLISRKLCPFFILATWIIAMAFHSPYLVAFKLVGNPGGMMCVRKWQEAFGGTGRYANYLLATVIVVFYIPSVLLVILYTIILIKLKKQAHPGEQSANNAEQRTRRNNNVLKMAIAIVLVSAFCWVPFVTSTLLFYYAPEGSIWSSCSFKVYRRIFFFMAIANCAINPFICLSLSSNYRQGLKKLLTCFGQAQG